MNVVKDVMRFVDFLQGKKTYFVATVMALHAVVITGWQQKNWGAAYTELVAAGGLVGVRSAISKV